jgi:hypothetical protein
VSGSEPSLNPPGNGHPPAGPLAAPDFSLMMGGPLYQLWLRTRMSGNALELLHRRTIFLVAFTWLPLLALAIAGGRAWGDGVHLVFLRDVEMHLRLLVALPLLLAAELTVHRWTRDGISQLLGQSIIPEHEQARFRRAVDSAMALRNSLPMEIALLATVYVVGIGYVWNVHLKLEVDSWYGLASGGGFSLTPAGWWAALVSLPLFQFILVRWFYRVVIWGRLLFQVSRLDLSYLPAHPDRCGGIGFLANISLGFAPIMLAVSTLLSGVIADRVFYQGGNLTEFTVEIVGIVVLLLVCILGPLFFFSPGMARAKHAGQLHYSQLANTYVRAFNHKWLGSPFPPEGDLLGNADFQSLADVSSAVEVVNSMRLAPLTMSSLVQLVVITLLPLAPLLLTMFPLDELLQRVLGVLF